jgi:hypothetical protein
MEINPIEGYQCEFIYYFVIAFGHRIVNIEIVCFIALQSWFGGCHQTQSFTSLPGRL